MIGLFAAAIVPHYSNLNHVSSHKTCNKTAGTSLKNAFTLNETSFRGALPPLNVSRVHTGLNRPLAPAAYSGGGLRAG